MFYYGILVLTRLLWGARWQVHMSLKWSGVNCALLAGRSPSDVVY